MKIIKKLGTTGVAAAALLFAGGLLPVAQAQIISLTAGNFTINANGYSASTLSNNLSDSAPGGLVVGPGGQREDTWGIFQITSILDGATTVYTDNGDNTPSMSNPTPFQGEYWGFFYNSYDTAVGPGSFPNSLAFTGTGLRLDIYKVDVLDANDSKFQSVYLQGIVGRVDLDSYKGVTQADVGLGILSVSKVLSSTLVGNLESQFFGNTNTTSANGNLAITSNSLFSGPGAVSNLTFALSGQVRNVPADWTVKFDGPIDGEFTAVPEPSTYSLIGACALVGMIAFRRLKKNRGQVA